MNIIHLSTSSQYHENEKLIRSLHEQLLKSGRSSWLLCRKGSEMSHHPGRNLVPIQWRGEWDMVGMLRIMGVCKQLRPAILHCHDGHALNHGVVVASSLHIPLMVTRYSPTRRRPTPRERLKYGLCRWIIATSPEIAQGLNAAPAEKIRVMPSAGGQSFGSQGIFPLVHPLAKGDDTFRTIEELYDSAASAE